jgi:sugar (pentulose or hexulose) kinase
MRMKKPIWIGVDIGTAGVRAAAYEADGQCHGAASREYGLQTPRPGWVEQDPAEIVAAMEAALQELSGSLARQTASRMALP